ncbi:hypothetical protein [Amycolatopsis sp. H20-H5]|uniref:hypothetical protein n=1 Tax=Amycolatopsis sp. H20-H5 TaxID=3046309 RepID=UPI002DBBAC1F|nr:hypothetical protein [Amycolatopsis sp. H20-H5]MEC3979304.1 hypothetical protein [Amycolatopsis sp. H20-H5]
MHDRTRVAVLLDRHQPGRSVRSIAASAGLPAASLDSWLDAGSPTHPAALVSVDTMCRVAAATGVALAVVSRAFTGTWFDLNGWQWNHFQPGDRVVVFSAPDPETRTRTATYGTVSAVDPLDVIEVDLDDGTRYLRNPESDGQICHVSGGCHCVTAH